MTQNNSTEDDDLIKRKTSSDRDSDITYEPIDRPVEFTRKISVKASVQSRLGSNVKSRLGAAPSNTRDEQSVKKRIGLPLKSRLGKESLANRLGPRTAQENRGTTPPTTVATNSNSSSITTRSVEHDNEQQTQPRKKKLILIKRKQPSEPKIENAEVQVKKSKPSPESKPEPKTEPTNHNAEQEVTSQKSEPVAEIKSQTPKAKKVTKVSVTDDLEDELLEGGDDLELGNEIIDDDLFDL